MPNDFFFWRKKINESTREENNAYFDTSLKMMPKSDEPQYCNNNVETSKATNFNYQLEVCKKLRGIDTICATYNVSLFSLYDVME